MPVREDADSLRVRRVRAATVGGRRYVVARPRRRALRLDGGDGRGAPPPVDADSRWLAEHPRPAHRLLWPFYVAMALPWVMWGAALLLVHLGICALCVTSGDISLPFPGL
ncbi:MAG TPA: hypothetical protein VMV93_09640 [Chloroflexota bacterium]|nr:hypothetical protein [Chloroflexota bacterium]